MRRFPELVQLLMRAAFDKWSANGWHTFDQMEANCTVQLYRWLVEAKRADSRLAFLAIELEFLMLTPAMLAGEASGMSAKRPDVCLSVGRSAIHVECKRLRVDGSWCRDYVGQGMARFVGSSYGAGEALGLMVGYVQQEKSNGLLDAVNSVVLSTASMGSSHQLTASAAESFGTSHHSTHARASDVPIELRHLWVLLGDH